MTHGEHIKQLALSLDGVSKEQLDWISRLIKAYTKKTLNIQKTVVFFETDGKRKTYLDRRKLGDVYSGRVESIKDAKNNYRCQAFMAFDNATPLWIVSKSGKRALQGVDEYLDLWSNRKKIPKFRPKTKNPDNYRDLTKTSISIPLKNRRDKSVFGVINFRSDDYVEPTDEAIYELQLLATATSYLYSLYEIRSISDKHTNEAINIVEERLKGDLPILTRPVVFVASPKNADKAIVDSIISTLENYRNKIDYILWQRMENPGNIIVHLLETINKCRYGICYFSDKDNDGRHFDNPNVIFEAGMFHGRRNADTSSTWIPIREKESPEMFFDLAQERTILVERNSNGGLKKKLFQDTLNRRIASMIHQQYGEESAAL